MFVHGLTFGGHPVAAAAALANLDIFEREDLCGHVREKEGEFRAQLDSLRDLPIVGDVRGAGFFYAHRAGQGQGDQGGLQRRGVGDAAARLPVRRALRERPDLPRRRPRRPGDPAVAAAGGRHRAVRGDRRASCAGSSPRPPRRWARPRAQGAAGGKDAHAPHPRRRDGAGAGERRGGRGRARAVGAHHRAARPHAVAVRRRADPHHRAAAQEREAPARVRPPARRPPPGRPRVRHRLRARRSCRRRWSTRLASSASRCSRCRTSCRSSRSPRRRSRGW